jgi:integrase
MAKALTVKALENLRPGKDRQEIPDGLIHGLYFVMQPSGAASWAVRYRAQGRTRKMTLGSYPEIGLKPARDLASAALVAVAKGDDPGADKQATKKQEAAAPPRDEVEKVVALFIERYVKAKNKLKHIIEASRLLNREIAEPWKGRRLGEISKADCHDLLDAIVDRGSPIAANRTLAALRKLCNWAIERGIISASPVQGIKMPSAETSRERVLTEVEIKAVWAAFEAAAWPFGPLAQLLLLTGCRRDECAAMTWAEVDFKTRTWIIPPARAKNRQQHEVPLSDAAIALLEALPRIASERGYVFTTNGRNPVSGYSKAKLEFDRLIMEQHGEPIAPWRIHDLRRTFASHAGKLGIAPHVIDAALAHKNGVIKGIAAVYNRHSYLQERRGALEIWARYLTALVTGDGQPAGNVVRLMQARA